MTTPLLTVNQLSKTFLRRGEAVRAVDNVSFNLHAGETWALVGNPAAVKAPPGGWFWG